MSATPGERISDKDDDMEGEGTPTPLDKMHPDDRARAEGRFVPTLRDKPEPRRPAQTIQPDLPEPIGDKNPTEMSGGIPAQPKPPADIERNYGDKNPLSPHNAPATNARQPETSDAVKDEIARLEAHFTSLLGNLVRGAQEDVQRYVKEIVSSLVPAMAERDTERVNELKAQLRALAEIHALRASQAAQETAWKTLAAAIDIAFAAAGTALPVGMLVRPLLERKDTAEDPKYRKDPRETDGDLQPHYTR